MERTPSAVIRKIVLGSNPKDEGLAFTVGPQKFGNIITNIVEDVNHFYIFGRIRFLIYVKVEGELGEKLWKAFDGVPVTIEYDLNKSEVIV